MGANQSEYSDSSYKNYEDNTDSINIVEISEEVFDRIKNGFGKTLEIAEPENETSELIEQQKHIKTQPVEYRTLANDDMFENIEPPISYGEVNTDLKDEINWADEISTSRRSLSKTELSLDKKYDIDKKSNNSKNVLFGFRRSKPCKDLEKKLIACYKSNSGFTLACTNEARAFINCVTTELIGAEEEDEEIFLNSDQDDEDDVD